MTPSSVHATMSYTGKHLKKKHKCNGPYYDAYRWKTQYTIAFIKPPSSFDGESNPAVHQLR